MGLSRPRRPSRVGRNLISITPVVAGYRELLERFDAWFVRTREGNPGIIPCRAGCSDCCLGPFDISVADLLLLREGWNQLSPADRHDVRDRAEQQVARMKALEEDWDMRLGIEGLGEDSFDRLSETLRTEPCPMLDQAGRCRVYAHRPLVCRVMGLGIRTPHGREIENACPIIDRFPLYLALPTQELDLEDLEEEEMAYLEASSIELFGTPLRSTFETTIALAVVQFFPKDGIE